MPTLDQALVLATLAAMVALFVEDRLRYDLVALIMAPMAAGLASKLDLEPDPFLMAVVIGCACGFLIPIGHQGNTLVMGPGGYRFGDHWRLGLPLSAIVAAVAPALIPLFWPLR